MTTGTKNDPWELTTPPGSSAYQMWRDEDVPPLLEHLGFAEVTHDARNNSVRAS